MKSISRAFGFWLLILAAPVASAAGSPPMQPLTFDDLPGFAEDDHLAAFETFLRTCAVQAPLRAGAAASPALQAVCSRAFAESGRDAAAARAFFEANFRPYRILPKTPNNTGGGFLTGYYEPAVEGSLTPTAEFSAPLLARPDDLVTLPADQPIGLDPALAAARRLPDGTLGPYPDRAAIESGAIAGHTRPLVFLRDKVEVFLIQVQGSARVRLRDGSERRLVYAGRNGQPYTSIGRILVETGAIPLAEMSLARLKAWIRAAGQMDGAPGAALMLRNASYIFFSIEGTLAPDAGPIGGAGVSLTPLRSIAVDRTRWAYGLPFWIDADLPWRDPQPTPFRRLMVAQDTGSAIVGPARVDVFFGTGDDAGRHAGDIRHAGDVIVLLPRDEDPAP